jgi:hypothetical protein
MSRFAPASLQRLEPRRLLASVTGIVFHDVNADGAVNEPYRIPSATVYADLNHSAVRESGEPLAVSDGDGNYQLLLDPGTYRIRAQFPSGYVQPNPFTGHYNVTVAGTDVEHLNIGALTASKVTGTVYNDRNQNGVNEEAVLPNREVYLDLNRNGAQEPDEPFNAVGTNGLYAFNLKPGAYSIRAVLPPGWRATGPTGGNREVTVLADTGHMFEDFGQSRTAQFTGLVYNDANGNGRRDLTEAAAVGWEVWADQNRNGVRDAGEPVGTSAADGYVSLDVGGNPGNFTVTPKAGWASPPPVQYSTQDWTGAELTHSLAVRQQSRLTGTVRQDVTGSGGGNGLEMPGIGVYVDLNNNASRDAGEPMTQTDEFGVFYLARGPGTYTVRTVLPAGYTYVNAGSAGRTGTIPAGGPVDVNVGTFAPYKANADNGAVTGTIREVQDRGPMYGPGERPLAGVTVWLDQNFDDQPNPGEPSTQTDASGYYAIWGLKFGAKYLRAALPAGYVTAAGRSIASVDYSSGGGARDSYWFNVFRAAAPAVVDQGARYDAAARPTLWAKFNKNVAYSLEPADVVLRNTSTGEAFPVTVTWDGPRFTATFSPVVPGGALPDGNYRATLRKGYLKDALGQASTQDVTFDFFVLAGDANRDRTVNFTDLLALAKNYNQSGKAYADGDFNGDGLVNFADLLILAKAYNKTLPAPSPAPLMSASSSVVTPRKTGLASDEDTAKPVYSTKPVERPAPPTKAKPVPRPAKR